MPSRSRIAALTLALALIAPHAHADIVPAAKAADHVGKEVTVEGRVVATYDSPLATVLAFAPNFAGFTATILAGDRPKFPTDIEAHYRGRLVQLTGPITAYRGKPEMTVRDPSQLTLVVDPNTTPTPAAAPTRAAPLVVLSPNPDLEQMRETLAAIEDRLGGLEARLVTIERVLATQAADAQAAQATFPTPAARVRGLGLGVSAAGVRAALGQPNEVRRGVDGSDVWLYGTGRTVSFDTNGRVVAWTGF